MKRIIVLTVAAVLVSACVDPIEELTQDDEVCGSEPGSEARVTGDLEIVESLSRAREYGDRWGAPAIVDEVDAPDGGRVEVRRRTASTSDMSYSMGPSATCRELEPPCVRVVSTAGTIELRLARHMGIFDLEAVVCEGRRCAPLEGELEIQELAGACGEGTCNGLDATVRLTDGESTKTAFAHGTAHLRYRTWTERSCRARPESSHSLGCSGWGAPLAGGAM